MYGYWTQAYVPVMQQFQSPLQTQNIPKKKKHRVAKFKFTPDIPTNHNSAEITQRAQIQNSSNHNKTQKSTNKPNFEVQSSTNPQLPIDLPKGYVPMEFDIISRGPLPSISLRNGQIEVSYPYSDKP